LFVRERTLALLDAATGLRVSELLALRWSDVDFENLELNVTRSIWHQVVGNCKTEASAKPVPMDSYMAEDLLRWRRQSDYASDDDFVFASETMKGKQPYWPDNLMKRHIRPVARANGINKNIGWHTFRHSFGTLLSKRSKVPSGGSGFREMSMAVWMRELSVLDVEGGSRLGRRRRSCG
jgi:integrase